MITEREDLRVEAEKSINPAAAIALYSLMSDLSECCWCASWMSGNGRELWKMSEELSVEVSVEYGMDSIDYSDLRELRRLSTEADCWWEYSGDSIRCYLLEEWRIVCAAPPEEILFDYC